MWALERPKKTFFEKAGWLDHLSNTMRRVAERGESGAYDLYKNPNPSPRNAYENANIHQVNLTDLNLYRTSEVYQRAKQIRNAFLAETEAAENVSSAEEALSADDIAQIRQVIAELMDLHRREGAHYPIVAQSVLEVAQQLLPLQQKYQFFAASDLPVLKSFYKQILSRPAQCSQGGGYRIFCEGRADALDGFVLLAQTPEDARLIGQVLEADLQQPLFARELLSGAQGLLVLQQERFLGPVLDKAAQKEGDNFWQKIDVFMTGWWLRKIQFSQGRYLGNVTALAVLPQAYEQADGNAWEELAKLLYNQGKPSKDSLLLLEKYGLGSCKADLADWDKGRPLQAEGELFLASVRCQTLLPFLVGVLDSGVQNGAQDSLAQAAARVHLSPAAFVARLYFENVMGDLNAETELRLDHMLYGVFEKEIKAQEKSRLEALEQNRRLDQQIQVLQQQLRNTPSILGSSFIWNNGTEAEQQNASLLAQISQLNKQKVKVPAQPDNALEKYDRQSQTYQRKQRGQAVYAAVQNVSCAIDAGLSIYYTLALPAMAVKGVQWTMALRRGVLAVRAGHITADVRKLAALSARLKKIRSLKVAETAQRLKKSLTESFVQAKQEAQPALAWQARQAASGREPRAVRHITAVSQPITATAAAHLKQAVRPVKSIAAPATVAVGDMAAPVRSGGITRNLLRTARLSAEKTTTPLAWEKFNVPQMQQAAFATAGEMQKLAQQYSGSVQKILQDLQINPARMGRAMRDVRDYARMEKDLTFYQKIRKQLGLREERFPSLSIPMNQGLFSLDGEMRLANQYISLLQKRFASLPEGSSVAKAAVGKELKAAFDIAEELTPSQALVWPQEGIAPVMTLRQRVKSELASGRLSAFQQQEAHSLLRDLLLPIGTEDQQALLQLRTLNLPFLQKSPNTLWIWGEGLSGYNMLERKAPLGFPMNQIFYSTSFTDIAPFFKKGKENVLLVNGHSYISRSGVWKTTLIPPVAGELRPAATLSAEKIIQASLQADSPRTYVYLHNCQAGALFKDLGDLFKKYPQAAKRTEWFTITAPMQPLPQRPQPLGDLGVGVRERLFNKLLQQITDNGSGLAARAWVKGRDVYPLRASVQRLEREIALAPAAEKAALETLQNDLQLLLNIADASDSSQLRYAMEMFRWHHPHNMSDGAFGGFALNDEGFSWGIKHFYSPYSLNMTPYIKLEKEWVNYVADTARQMFGLLSDAPAPTPAWSAAGAVVREAVQAQKDLQRAPGMLAQVLAKQKEGGVAWTEQLLRERGVQDFSVAVEKGRQIMQGLEEKWAHRQIMSLPKLQENHSLMRQALQDAAYYAQLEKQTNAAEELFSLYNRQAGFETWEGLRTAHNPSGIFARPVREELGRQYIKYLSDLRDNQPAVLHPATDREIRSAVQWIDQLGPDFSNAWSADWIPSAAVLRARMAVLGKNKQSFTPLQRQEYASIMRALYRHPILGKSALLEMHNRVLFLPKLERTPNTVFVWGDELLPSQVWDRKTLLGFLRPKIKHFELPSTVLKDFKPHQENVLLLHVHGGVSKKGEWKGLLVEGDSYPSIRLRAQDILQGVSKSQSAHSYIFANSCFSGTLLNNVRALKSTFPETIAKSDWFVTGAPMQYSAAEVLPAEFSAGTARQRLFGKMLSRMRYNGDGLAGRALIEGKEIYPLKQSIYKLNQEIKKAAGEKKAELTRLQEDLILLKAVADSQTSQELHKALLNLQEARPGIIEHMKLWQKGSALLEKQQRLPAAHRGPTGFGWGVDKAKNTSIDLDPYIILERKWVDYVAQTAEEMFAKVNKYPTGVKPVFEAESFHPVYSSKASEYILKKRSLAPSSETVPASFFRIPVQFPAEEKLAIPTMVSLNNKKALLAEYNELIKRFEALRKETDTALYYVKNKLSRWDFSSRKKLSEELLQLRQEMLLFQAQNKVGSALQPGIDWLENALEIIFPAQRGRVLEMPIFPRPDRVYKQREFFLRDANGRSFDKPLSFASSAQKQQWLAQQKAQLPAGLRVAVLNDDAVILSNYKTWLANGGLGKDSHWSFYSKMDEFLAELDKGVQFDLILTDLNFADGGAHYFVSWMRANGDIRTPVIASSSFADEAVDGARLLKEGFDGYLSTRHLSLGNGDGNLLRALNNYFKYREKNKWVR